MDLIEIRDLDGPNLFALEPVIRIAVDVGETQFVPPEGAAALSVLTGQSVPVELVGMATVIQECHRSVGEPLPRIGQRALDMPNHHALSFSWEWRSFALRVADLAVMVVRDGGATWSEDELRGLIERDRANGDRPEWVRDDQRRVPAAGITGTNGKTTTTRLLAHIIRGSGRRVGWSSSTGVYIDGEQVLEGDYTGPTGARRVLSDPSVDLAVLETARGGILLRGLAYESNDVGVFINVSADHLDMQGVTRLETLAEVKSVVVRVTKPEGLVVLNADDPLVLAQREHVRAPVLLFSQRPESDAVLDHVRDGRWALVSDGKEIVLIDGSARRTVAPLRDVPMTYAGAAPHMVENALAATGAAIGLGLDLETIAAGLRTFRPDIRHNPGRLNVFRLDGRTVVIDYAHNESGLEALIAFTRRLMDADGTLHAIVGTAGDRQDDVMRRLGRIAAEQADRVYLKDNPKYLRGRELAESLALMRQGMTAAGGQDRLAGEYGRELDAVRAAIAQSEPGDAIAAMCVEDQLAVLTELRDRGAVPWGEA